MQALLWKRCTTVDLRTQTRARCGLHQVSCAGFTPPCAFITSHYNSLVLVCPSFFPAPAAVPAAHSPRERDRLLSTMPGVHRACRLSGEHWTYPPSHLPTPASQLFRVLGISPTPLYVCLLPFTRLLLGIILNFFKSFF